MEARTVKRYKAPSRTAIKEREYDLKYTYGLTLDRYSALLEAQGGRCAICGTTDPGRSGGPNPDARNWAVDHDHTCCPIVPGVYRRRRSCGECVRGLLCHSCNKMLGFAKESPATLQAAIDYLGGA